MLDVCPGGGDDGLVLRLFLGQLVEIGIGFGVGGVDFFELLMGGDDFTQSGFDLLAHGVVGIQLRFLRQVADGNAWQPLHFAVEVLIRAGHDSQHGGFA